MARVLTVGMAQVNSKSQSELLIEIGARTRQCITTILFEVYCIRQLQDAEPVAQLRNDSTHVPNRLAAANDRIAAHVTGTLYAQRK